MCTKEKKDEEMITLAIGISSSTPPPIISSSEFSMETDTSPPISLSTLITLVHPSMP